MDCRAYREGHPLETREARAHREACAECRAFAASWELLRAYPELPPQPRFFRGVRAKLSPAVLRFAGPLAAAAAALLVAAVLYIYPTPRKPDFTEEERELVENLDLLQNYELLRTLEFVGETRSSLLEVKK